MTIKLKMFNVSRRRGDLARAVPQGLEECGWPEDLAPALDRLCSVCKIIENWLNLHPLNLVVIHCKGGIARAAIVVAAYMHYTTICARQVVQKRIEKRRSRKEPIIIRGSYAVLSTAFYVCYIHFVGKEQQR